MKQKVCKSLLGCMSAILCVVLAFSQTPAYAMADLSQADEGIAENAVDASQVSSDTENPEEAQDSSEGGASDASSVEDFSQVDASQNEANPEEIQSFVDDSGEECTPQDIEKIDISGIQDEDSISLMSDYDSYDYPSFVKLKDTNEVRWFDRVEFPSKYKTACDNLYRTLVQASNNDGVNDYLIEDKYIQEGSTTPNVTNEYRNFASASGGLLYSGIVIGSVSYTDNYEKDIEQSILDDCTYAVMAAFDRDHPEVFWLNSYTFTFYMVPNYPDGDGVYTATKYLLIGGFDNLGANVDRDNIRSISFGSEDSIKSAISLREERTRELLAKVGVDYEVAGDSLDSFDSFDFEMSDEDILPDGASNVGESSVKEYSDAEKVRFFNKWLTYSNGYNTQDLNGLSSTYPLAFECLSALAGRTGRVGPVCEAYSRAMKVLCDAAGIPCVLVDGLGNGGAHMWNSIQVDGKWYGTDVTWNDPYVNGSIAKSGYEDETYLLVGSNTLSRSGITFYESHLVENRFYANGLCFINHPVIEEGAYELPSITTDPDDIPYKPSDYPDFDLSFLDKDIGLARISAIADMTYTGSPIAPVPTVTLNGQALRPNIDYACTYSSNINVGRVLVKIQGIGDYAGSNSTAFSIVAATFGVSGVKVADKVYTGKALTPAPTVTLTNSAMRNGIDYVVETTYSNNKNAGKASVSVVVRGIGNYTGAILKTATFKISPKKMSAPKLTAAKRAFTVKWSKGTTGWCTGYQIRYSTSSKFKTKVKTSTVKSRTTVKKTFKKLSTKKRYYVSIRAYKTVGGVKYYGAWSSTKSIRTR